MSCFAWDRMAGYDKAAPNNPSPACGLLCSRWQATLETLAAMRGEDCRRWDTAQEGLAAKRALAAALRQAQETGAWRGVLAAAVERERGALLPPSCPLFARKVAAAAAGAWSGMLSPVLLL